MRISSRREFLVASALSMGSFVVSTALGGCSENASDTEESDSSTLRVSFNHGVASGDPQQNSMILWTRATPSTESDRFNIAYEVATDAAFTNLVRPKESATVQKSGDYTLKVDFQDLEASTTYYYRFSYHDTLSATGVCKTLPSSAESLKMVVFSCANYPKGYFNAYELAAKETFDVALHLGDYIYEYGMFEKDGVTPAYATENATNIGRALPENGDTELFTLDDYRQRYALYRSDSGLQALHAKGAMIAVWDDHEVANDTYKDGAENHSDDEGDFSARKQAALQAYFEWLPIRPVTPDNQEIIYRQFEFGDLVSLYMLDTRNIGRDKQLDYASYPELANGDANAFTADLTSVTRTILGADQLTWLQSKMGTSNATWQVLGQQVLMGRMLLPAEILTLLGALGAATSEQEAAQILAQITTSIGELALIKGRYLQNDPSLTVEEITRIKTVLPYNLDAWDGYFYEREVVLGLAAQLQKNLIILSGDTHNSWANTIRLLDENTKEPSLAVAAEFAVTSVSSPGMEEYVNLTTTESAQQFEQAITLLIDDLHYFNASDRGFMLLEYTKEHVTCDWKYVDNIDSTTFNELTARTKQLRVAKNQYDFS